MALSPAQVEVVREIALLKTLAEAQSLADGLTADQETAMIQIVEVEWPAIRFTVGHLVPNRKDLLNSQIEKRRLVRHTVRMMLGLDPVSQAEIDMAELDGTYGAVIGGAGGSSGASGGGSAEFGIFTQTGFGRRGSGSDAELS